MHVRTTTSTVLGIAFLLQAIGSLAPALRIPLIEPQNIPATLIRVASHPALMRTSIVAELITAILILVLGVLLFLLLRKINEDVALVALSCFLLEVALPSPSRIAAFSLLRISQEYVASGYPAALHPLAALQLDSMDLGYKLLMLPCCVGLILFYWLLYQSRLIPRALSLWGLIAIAIALVGTLGTLVGYDIPFVVYAPYVPVEFVVGAWIWIRGFSTVPQPQPVLVLS